ncbi:MAG TPA: SpoIIE family protein phosphatase [Pantanalinema sp.]
MKRLSKLAFWGTMSALLVVAVATFVLSLAWINRPFPGFVVLRNNSVDSLSSARWTGFQNGIKQRDHLLAVNGTPVRDGGELYRIVRAKPPGTVFTYTLERPTSAGMSKMSLTVPSQPFRLNDWVGFFLTFWGIGLFHLLTGLFVSIVKPGDTTARAHLLFCVFFGTFLMTAFDGIADHVFTYFPHNPSFALLGFAALNLAMLVPRPLPVIKRLPRILLVNMILGLGYMAFTMWSFEQPAVWPNNFIGILAVDSISVLLIGASSFWARWSATSSPQIKRQANVILWGALLAFLPAIVFNTLAGLGVTIPFGELTFFGMVIFPASVAYTIVRLRLFDIDVIIKRTVTYSLMSVALAMAYFVLTLGIRSLFGTGGQMDPASIIATGVVVLLVAPLRDRTKVLVDKLFFRSGYDLARLLTDFGDRARETFDPQELLRTFVSTIDHALQPTYVAVLLKNGESGALLLRESKGLAAPGAIVLAQEDPALRALFVGRGLSISLDPIDLPGMSEATATPLRLKEELVGLVLVGPRKSDQLFNSTDRTLMVGLGQHLALWIKNAELFGQLAGQARLKRELEIAHEVQTGLLPTSLPAMHGVEFAATSIPALEVGGDFYDVIQVDEHRFGVLIGDVSGKGVPAALLMAMTLVIFRSIAPGNPSATDVMAKANELIFLNRPSRKMFVTAFYAVYDSRDRTLTYANAGNPLPIGTSGRLEAKGVSLGMFPTATYDGNTAVIEPGELLVLYSDGAEDAINPTSEQFGEERLAEIVFANRKEAPKDVEARILETIRKFSEGSDQFDDITLVTLRAN